MATNRPRAQSRTDGGATKVTWAESGRIRTFGRLPRSQLIPDVHPVPSVRSLTTSDARAVVVYMKGRGLQLQRRLELRGGRDDSDKGAAADYERFSSCAAPSHVRHHLVWTRG